MLKNASCKERDLRNFTLLAGRYPKAIETDINQITRDLGYNILNADIDSFKSQERYCELYAGQKNQFNQNLEDIKDATVHVVLYATEKMDNVFVDAINISETLKEYGAGKVHMILPFAPYARQDRKFDKRFVSIMGRTLPKHLKYAGVDTISTFDVHSKASEKFYTDFFGIKNVQFLSADNLIYQEAKKNVPENSIIKVGAPDGSNKPNDVAQAHAREITRHVHGEKVNLKEHMFFIEKKHISANETVSEMTAGNVENAVTLIRDDMTDTCGTLVNAAKLLKENRASMVIASVTHGIFSGDSLQKVTADLIDGKPNPIDIILTTDSNLSIYNKVNDLPPKNRERVKIVSTKPLIRKALQFNPQ